MKPPPPLDRLYLIAFYIACKKEPASFSKKGRRYYVCHEDDTRDDWRALTLNLSLEETSMLVFDCLTRKS